MALVDHIDTAINHLITQYKESETVKDYLRAVLEEANELEQVYCDLIQERFIETAEGKILDIIGSLVGQSRILIDATQLVFFGFDGAAGAASFGEVGNPLVGGRFRSVSEDTTGNNVLTDPEYRLFIRARIIKNYTRATLEEIISMAQFILDADTIVITEGDRSYTVGIGRLLTLNEQALIANTDLMPKPVGIRASYAFFNPDSYLSFTSVGGSPITGGLGFGTVSSPTVGGSFSSIIN